MKTALVFATLFISSFSFAQTYSCIGLDEGAVQVNVTDTPKEIGHSNGREVFISGNDEFLGLMIKDGKLSTVISAPANEIVFHQNDGGKIMTVTCKK